MNSSSPILRLLKPGRQNDQKPNSMLYSAAALGAIGSLIAPELMFAEVVQTFVLPQGYRKTDDGRVILRTQDGQPLYLTEEQFVILEDGLLLVTDELAQNTMQNLPVMGALRANGLLTGTPLASDDGGFIETTTDNPVWTGGRGPIQDFGLGTYQLAQAGVAKVAEETVDTVDTDLLLGSGVSLIALVSGLFGATASSDQTEAETPDGGTGQPPSGGGGGGGGGTTFSGTVIKGPLVNAFVFFDENGNGLFDAGEPNFTTSSTGGFSISSSAANPKLIVTTNDQTIDTTTGTILSGMTFKSPLGASVVSPLTTMMEETGLSVAEIKSVLGLPATVNPLTFNPYAPGVNAADALAAEQVSAQTMVTLAAFAATAAGTGISQQDAFAAALSALSSVMQSKSSGGGTLDLTDPTDLAAVQSAFTTAVGSIPGVTADQTTAINGIIGDATTAIQNVNNKIASITNTDLSSAANGNIFGLLQVLQDQVEKAAEDEKTTPGSGTIGFTDPTAVDNAATNSAPTDIDLSASSISEDASSLVVGVLTTTDDSTSDFNFTYEIAEIEGSIDHTAFSINPTNGELSFGSQPDFETKSSYTITIIATDEGGKSFSETFTITVINAPENEAPTVTGVVISGAESDGSTPKSGTLVAGDKILVTVTVDENITVDTSGGTPQYTIDVGGVSKTAGYVSGSGGTSLVFAYEVQAGDLDDAGGITSDTSALDANSGTLQDSDGHDLDLTTIVVSAGANTVGVDAASPTVTGVVISGAESDGSTPKSGTLVAGDKILVTVTVDENITVDTSGGTPQYTIDVGGVSKTAGYVSGSGGTSLVFAYEVQAGDLDDAGGITSDTSALDANSGTLQDSDGHDLDLTTIVVSAGANTVGVDAASPTVTGVVISGAESDGSTPKSGTLVAGDKILVTVTVDENITVDTSGGTPQYTIDVGGVSKTAGYVSGSGGTSLVFAYEVQAGDLDDAGGITSDTSALDANSGTLQDSDGHDLDLTTIVVSAGANTVGVDAASPTVTGVVISGAESDGSTPKSGTLVAGDKILVTVTVDENITVDTSGGTPQYTIDVGGVSKTAGYVSGSGGTSLVFAYEVQAGDLDDAGGITSDTSALDANSGTLQDSDGHDLDLTTIVVSAGANTVGVDAASPTVTGVVISGAESDGSTPKSGTLVAGDKILVTVTVDENITVDTSGGTPQYTIDVGGVSKTAGYVSGSGGTSLVFAYEVQAGDLDDAGGITSDTSALDANSGTLQDSDGHDLDLTTIVVSAGANTVGVDAASPTVTGVVISGAESDGSTPKSGTLVAGDKILVTVTVDENITVDTSGGTPQYTIDVGGVSKTAGYVSGSGGTSLVFAYEVQAGDLDDAGGITSDTSALDANSGTLQDSDGHDLDLTTIVVSAGANTVGVDAASPTVTGVVISGAESDGSTPKSGTLVAGDKILVTVTVDENITVDTSGGTPQYTIDVGGVSKTAGYVSGSGGTSLVFAYEVQAGDLDDAGGITSDTSALDANSGTLQDSDGHDLDLTTIVVSAGANTVGVDAASPTVTGVVISGAESDGSTPKSGTLVAGDKILVTVTVDENITVDTSGGTPQYTIDVGGVSKTAGYVSGSGGTSLVFAYEVQAGDLDDAGGITSDTSALDANSGTLQDSDGHDLDLTTIVVSAGANTVGVDAASPTVTGVVISGAESDGSTPKSGTLVAGDKILVTVTVDENITVDTSGGTPQYTIDVGGVSKTAGYVSGSGGTSLVFAYEVQAGDLDDAGGITSDTSALDANSGTLQDSDGHDLDLTTIVVSAGANTVGVDAASPTVTGVVISGAESDGSTPKSGTLVAGDKILVTVTVDENITVDTSGGTPQYTIDVGGVSKTAGYVSGSGGTSLVFAYEVQAGDLDDAGGITSDTSALDANSGTLQDSDGHDLDLTTIVVSAGANTVGVDAASPTVTGVVISGAESDGSTPKSGTLVAGDKILVTVTVDENITVDTSGGTPQYTIDVGGVSKTAGYVSGSGGTSLVFAYEVQAGDLDDAGGITSDTSALDANSGTLQDSDGHDLDLTTIVVSAGANTVGVDAASPTVTGVVISGAESDGSTPKSGTLVAGDKILVTVTVDENITVDTSGGTPQYTIDVGGVSKTAGYVSGSGGTSLVFAYEVQAGDLDDAGGITSDTSALDANSGTLQDSDGHDLDLTTIVVSAGANTVGVDAASPTVTGVVISGAESDGSTPKSGTLVAGDKILVTVTVDENITVDTSGGTPQYTIDVGGVSKTAGYVSGSGGTSLVFAYEVQAGDLDDAGGITSDTSALDANSGTLQDSDGHDLDLTTIVVSAGANTVGVDAASPTVTGVVISGAESDGSTPKSGTLVAGDKILVTVTVDENITVDTSGGTPQYTIDVGGVSKTAGYVSGSGGTSLVFAYEVQAGDLDDAGGITSDTSALDANSGTLQDSDGHDLDLTTIVVSAGANTVGVDAASPTVTGVVISGAESDGSTPKSGTLVAGDKILVTVTVDENITVDTSGGTPQYTIDVGGVSKTAGYVSGSGGTSLVFAYEVQAGDLDDAGGITSDTSALDANSGTLQDSDGHDLDLTTIVVSAGANTVGVDAASPTVTGVVISGAESDGSTPKSGTLVAGDKILVTVTVDENITVDTSGGTPQYTIDVGGVSKTAGYVSGSGGTSLVFAYEVQAGDLDDAGGITSDTSALDANSGTLQDSDGHDLDLTTIVVSAGANTVGVDAASPTVTGVVISGAESDGSTPKSGTLVAGDKILVTVTVDENITVDTSGGTPQYTIDVGGVSKTAGYVSGSGGTSLVFAYEVQAGDLDDAGGITSDTSALDANSGTLQDSDGHDLDLTTIVVSAGANTVGVDAASPTVTGVVISGAESDGSTPKSGTLVAGDKILVTVTVDENITVDTSGGTPQYTIDVGGVSKTAGYVSGSGGTSLVFAYEVQAGDLDDAGGITSDTSALDANSGTLQDSDGHDLDLTTIVVSAGANTVGVDAASPTVTGVVISGAESDGSTPKSGTLVAGDKILVTVTVDENITVDTSGGTPQYTIDVGGVSKTAGYVSGSGGTSLVFAYEVQAGDLDDAGGITSDTSALDANSGTLQDSDGHDLDLTTIVVSAGANTVGVDAASPTVTGVVISGAESDGSTPKSGTLVAGDKILVTVTVDENITVDTSGGRRSTRLMLAVFRRRLVM